MREKIRDRGRLEHIVEQLNNIEEFVANKTIKDLENDKVLQYAVIKCIEIIGEASYMLTNDLKNTHKEVEWEEIIRSKKKFFKKRWSSSHFGDNALTDRRMECDELFEFVTSSSHLRHTFAGFFRLNLRHYAIFFLH